jgi:aminopeptidase N
VEGGQKRESGVSLTAYTVPLLKADAEETLEMAARIVRLFTEEFGPCPYSDIGLVLIEAAKPGGHSPPGMVLLARRPVVLGSVISNDPANFSDQPGFFLAHELAHQWWGDGVAPASYHDRWISEAVAHYAAALWIRHSRGEDVFRRVMREMERWALDKNEAGPVSLGHRVGHLDGDAQLYRAVVYDKGACVLNMFRLLLGDSAFRHGLTDFQQHFRFLKAGTPDLRRALEEASGLDLAPYFEAWIYGTAVSSLSLAARPQTSGAGYRTALDIKARQLPGRIPVGVTLEGDGGRDTRVVNVPPEGGHWDIDTAFLPRKVRLNDDAGLLARIEN